MIVVLSGMVNGFEKFEVGEGEGGWWHAGKHISWKKQQRRISLFIL